MATDAVDFVIAQWNQECPELDASPMGFLGRTPRLASHIHKSLCALFKEFDILPGEFDVLATLRRSGKPYQLTPTTLFKSMMVASGTMTNRIDKLEAAQLVKRIPDPGDRRGTLIQLTEQGLTLIDAAVKVHVANGNRILSVLQPSEREMLATLQRKLLLSFEGDDPLN